MAARETNRDAVSLGLSALAWALGEPARAQRLLDLTGLTSDDLRTRADQPAVLAAVIAFLEAHEPDLVACAEALDVKPEALVRVHAELEA